MPKLGVVCLAVSLAGLALGQEEEGGSGLSDDLSEPGGSGDNATEPDIGLFAFGNDTEGSGDVDECWDLDFYHPSVRMEDSTDWLGCPEESPDTWREEDLDLNSCGKKGSSHLEEKLNAYQGEDGSEKNSKGIRQKVTLIAFLLPVKFKKAIFHGLPTKIFFTIV